MSRLSSLERVRQALGNLRFPLPTPGAVDGRDARTDGIHQLDDYVLPRLRSLDAPLVAVVGGSTGSGKSALVNALVGASVTPSSALRPTTRIPVLAHAPGEEAWFSGDRIFPGLARLSGAGAALAHERSDAGASAAEASGEIRLVESPRVPRGLALVDSPDIDSVEGGNRRLAGQLLQGADVWVFVTTAARYSDAIPWALLDEAAERNIVIAVVLNRVPVGDAAAIRPDLIRRLEERGLGSAPLFVITEYPGAPGIPEADVAPLREWLAGLSRDERSRASVARQTLTGALGSLADTCAQARDSYLEQIEEVERLEAAVNAALEEARASIESGIADGTVLRGEVLRRWHEMLGSGQWARALQAGVTRWRDRLSWRRTAGGNASEDSVGEAIEDSLTDMLLTADASLAACLTTELERSAAGAGIVLAVESRSGETGSQRDSAARRDAAGALVRDWRRALTDMLGEQGRGKQFTARFVSLGINAVGVALMLVVFAHSAGLTGGEVAIAGGTAVVAQRVLEAIFGDDAVRRMAATATEDLLGRTAEFFADTAAPYREEIARLGISKGALSELDEAMRSAEGRRGWIFPLD
ncbi:dynamin family protein [Actinotignum sanguinis]|uniref:Dynamin family protein n=3 Tax=Actinomycetaceae TaxID=2049 RepID=A0ABZ0RFM5_9ACTO|nr:dynamin family protein [Actinotignum sanguinis]WPJ89562.1 dynamin family protein [Schaalia turicensis]MDE1553631.1 dynamin family protein [Actinotignum sanguinis]MDE1565679.1 dynamin family protein [Actinotignum sanguinis]MDE1577813.1 dynamin family protein [Actinotignum sanguinis]MDE1642398.1 dynamin family protein [Actinotignum sanguinis]